MTSKLRLKAIPVSHEMLTVGREVSSLTMKCKSTETPIGWRVLAEAIVNGEGGHARKGGRGVIETCGYSANPDAAAATRDSPIWSTAVFEISSPV